MKKTWRWPLAGFLLGGLVGATFLTVNVVGASSPNAPPARVASFGEILHTPPLLARVGKAVELVVRRGVRHRRRQARREMHATWRGVRAGSGRGGFPKAAAGARAGRTAVRRRPGVQG